MLTRAPEYTRERKILEGFLIKSIDPCLDEQLDTWCNMIKYFFIVFSILLIGFIYLHCNIRLKF